MIDTIPHNPLSRPNQGLRRACFNCNESAACVPNTLLEDLDLVKGFWRLTNKASARPSRCVRAPEAVCRRGGRTPRRGSRDARAPLRLARPPPFRIPPMCAADGRHPDVRVRARLRGRHGRLGLLPRQPRGPVLLALQARLLPRSARRLPGAPRARARRRAHSLPRSPAARAAKSTTEALTPPRRSVTAPRSPTRWPSSAPSLRARSYSSGSSSTRSNPGGSPRRWSARSR